MNTLFLVTHSLIPPFILISHWLKHSLILHISLSSHTLSQTHGMSVISHMHFHHTYSLSSHASHTDSLSSHIISNIIYLLSLLQSHLTHTLITHALYSLSHHIFFFFYLTHVIITLTLSLQPLPHFHPSLSLSLFRSLSLSSALSRFTLWHTHTHTLSIISHTLSQHCYKSYIISWSLHTSVTLSTYSLITQYVYK